MQRSACGYGHATDTHKTIQNQRIQIMQRRISDCVAAHPVARVEQNKEHFQIATAEVQPTSSPRVGERDREQQSTRINHPEPKRLADRAAHDWARQAGQRDPALKRPIRETSVPSATEPSL